MGIRSRWISHALIVAFPILYIIIYLIVGGGKGPYYWTPNQDPDYAYLSNSLVVALLKVPRHTDHPGTPLQVLGAIVIWVSHFFRSLLDPSVPKSFTNDVLTHPETYLHLINFALLLVTAIALLLLGWFAYRLCKSLVLTLILQISPFLLIKPHLGDEPSRVSPDVLVFCISQILALVLINYLYSEKAGRSRSFALSLGAVFGVGMATKVTFIPMFLYFLLPRGWGRKGWAIGAAIGAFFLATLPIISRYERTWRWMTDLATHTGTYGGGEAGIVDPDSVTVNAALLLSRNPIFFGILGLATVLCLVFPLIWKYGKVNIQTEQRSPDFRKVYFLLGLTTLVMWGQTAITVKAQPQSRYLDPSAGLMGFLLFLIVQLVLVVITHGWGRPMDAASARLNLVIPAVVLALCVGISVQQTDASIDQIHRLTKRRNTELAQIQNLLKSEPYQSCQLVLSRRASHPESALKFADFWAGKQLGDFLEPLYPTSVFYIDAAKSYETFNRRISLDTLAQQGNGCILLEINSLPPSSRRARFLPAEKIERIFEGKHEALYRIKT